MQKAALRNARKLRDEAEFKGVYLLPSLTPQQLQEYSKKRRQLHYLRTLNSDWLLYRDEFWLRNKIGKHVIKTSPPDISENVLHTALPPNLSGIDQ